MFDLKPRVHLEKVELGVVAIPLEEELDGPGVAIARRSCRRDGRVAHARAYCRRQRERRTLFDDLLMPALDGALALEEMHDVAMRVGDHLDFDVTRLLDEAFDIQRAVAERRQGFAPRGADRFAAAAFVRHDPHAFAAAAG